MTHFVGMVVANDEEELRNILAKYNESLKCEPYFVPIGDLDNMIEKYGTSDIEVLRTKMWDWEETDGAIEDGILGYMSTNNPNAKWDWYVIGGRWADIAPENTGTISEVIEHFEDYCIDNGHETYIPSTLVDSNGWYSTKDWGWFGAYDALGEPEIAEYNSMVEKHKDSKVFVVDFHI